MAKNLFARAIFKVSGCVRFEFLALAGFGANRAQPAVGSAPGPVLRGRRSSV